MAKDTVSTATRLRDAKANVRSSKNAEAFISKGIKNVKANRKAGQPSVAALERKLASQKERTARAAAKLAGMSKAPKKGK